MPAKKQEPTLPDAELLAMLKDSGILNPDVRLEDLVKLSAKLDAGGQAKGGRFIFRDFLYRPC